MTSLCWNKAILQDVGSHMTSFNQKDHAQQCIATLSFVYDIGFKWETIQKL